MEKIINNISVPKPKNPEDLGEQFTNFVEIVKLLRIHCPWDRKQTNQSIAHLLIEEVYETLESIQNQDFEEFSRELGDLLLHIVMHSIMAEEQNKFTLLDVLEGIQEKLVFRHPHVFGSTEVNGVVDVLRNWEKQKKQEGKKSTLDGVPKSLPALLRAERIQEKASKVGFDWEKSTDVWNKVIEEIEELREAVINNNKTKIEEEYGDLIFALVNYARFIGITPELALQKANDKFVRRFKSIEKFAEQNNKSISDMTIDQMDAIWNETKSNENYSNS
ncbi:MAG: nucleoside triphosphate pyrophosphohydrolase [Candidatus Kapaibacteriales bacterium]